MRPNRQGNSRICICTINQTKGTPQNSMSVRWQIRIPVATRGANSASECAAAHSMWLIHIEHFMFIVEWFRIIEEVIYKFPLWKRIVCAIGAGCRHPSKGMPSQRHLVYLKTSCLVRGPESALARASSVLRPPNLSITVTLYYLRGCSVCLRW